MALLLENVELAVKLQNIIGENFITNIGSPQGDAASALFFIIYLVLALKAKENPDKVLKAVEGLLTLDPNNNIVTDEITQDLEQLNVTDPVPVFLQDHTYSKYEEWAFTVDQQYADDIGWASTATHILEKTETEVTDHLASRNLKINQSKTERYTVKKVESDS